MAAEYGDRADFYYVYVEEAHPKDGWVLIAAFVRCCLMLSHRWGFESNGEWNVENASTTDDRVSTAVTWYSKMLSDSSTPLLVGKHQSVHVCVRQLTA